MVWVIKRSEKRYFRPDTAWNESLEQGCFADFMDPSITDIFRWKCAFLLSKFICSYQCGRFFIWIWSRTSSTQNMRKRQKARKSHTPPLGSPVTGSKTSDSKHRTMKPGIWGSDWLTRRKNELVLRYQHSVDSKMGGRSSNALTDSYLLDSVSSWSYEFVWYHGCRVSEKMVSRVAGLKVRIHPRGGMTIPYERLFLI